MKERRTNLTLLGISLASFGVMSVSFMLMPVKQIGILPGLLFWLGLVFGVVFQIVLNVRRKAFYAKYKAKQTKMQKPKCGLWSFGSNKVALGADCIFGVGIIATVLAFVLTKGTGYVCYACISVLLWGFCSHCVLNGRNCFHAINQDKIRQALESKKESNSKKGEGDNGKK